MIWNLVLFAATAVVAADVKVQTNNGTTIDGKLVGLSATEAIIDVVGQERHVPLGEVLQIAPAATTEVKAPTTSGEVRLTDGTRLLIDKFQVTGGQATIGLAGDRSATVDAKGVQSVRLVEFSDTMAAQWEQMLKQDAAGDLLVVREDESLDYFEGVLGDITDETINFQTDGETVNVKRAKAAGLIYHHAPGDLPAIARVEDRLGSVFVARAVELAGDRLEVESPAGLKIALAWDDLARIDFSQGKVVYLSDLEWDRSQSQRTPYFGEPGPIDSARDLFAPQRDQALDGGPLRLAGQNFAKGLALHSRTKLVYRLAPGFHRFQALAGIDDRLDKQGQVRLEISGDGNALYEGTLSGGDQPVAIDVDITDVKRLTVLVDYAADQDVADHLDLCNPRIVK